MSKSDLTHGPRDDQHTLCGLYVWRREPTHQSEWAHLVTCPECRLVIDLARGFAIGLVHA